MSPVDTRINVPFIPQEGITGQILNAIQLANEHSHQQQQEALQSQQLGINQQQATSEIAQRGAQTAQTQAQTQFGLPQAEAAYKQAAAEHEQLQTQFEKETNPLTKSQLQQSVTDKGLDLQRKQLLLKMMTMTQGPSMFDQQIDSLAPPDGPNADLNKRTKIMAASALQIGDLEGARKAVDSAGSFLNELSKEKYNQAQVSLRESLNRQAAQSNQLQKNGLEQIDKMFTDPQHGYTQFLAQANATRSDLASAKDGNQLASSLAPLMTVLGVNSFAGVHRVNPMEYEAAGPQLGSIFRRINATLDKAGTGKLPEDTVKEMGGLIDGLIEAKWNTLLPGAKLVVANSGLDPGKTTILGPDGEPVTLGEAAKGKAATKTASQPVPPQGANMQVPGSDGKLHWSDGKEDLGIVQ